MSEVIKRNTARSGRQKYEETIKYEYKEKERVMDREERRKEERGNDID